ncbi:DUF4652 domain-containing protein [Clostridium sp. A1-XYC3]|uniref:DUF4652 domain-containing protein n=1 Tax=Clostridium tanneri TaxID=3037988 RepID=A0ABU4JPS9_9CLOT|nr:DUF4652 domain-containing protein [Clostridium sp. A1-XYC3]MDW8800122.1 DUF4652 domain-containing protein [Clostridium sp. A1-XYC3]
MSILKNKKRIYTLCSMSIVLLLALTACSNSQNKNTSDNNQTTTQNQSPKDNDNQNNTSAKEDKKEDKKEAKFVSTQSVNIPKFSKGLLSKSEEPRFGTPWKKSNNKSYSACIEGKGPEAIEEGVGKLFVKDKEGNTYSFEILNNDKISPRYIEWADDENLFVVIGDAHGTVSKGGNLYLINVVTGKTSLVLETSSDKQQVMEIKKLESNLSLKVNVYDDDSYNKSHVENWSISSFDVSLNKQMEVKDSTGKTIYIINKTN